jgi:hypothetical protein
MKYDRIKMQMQASARRRAHFAEGGTPAMWRGRAANDLDASSSKHKKNKHLCRKKVMIKDHV